MGREIKYALENRRKYHAISDSNKCNIPKIVLLTITVVFKVCVLFVHHFDVRSILKKKTLFLGKHIISNETLFKRETSDDK